MSEALSTNAEALKSALYGPQLVQAPSDDEIRIWIAQAEAKHPSGETGIIIRAVMQLAGGKVNPKRVSELWLLQNDQSRLQTGESK
jgi:hypothetical protein